MAVSFSRTTRVLDADRGTLARWALYAVFAAVAGWGIWFFTARISLYEVSRSARIEVAGSSSLVSAVHGGKLIASNLYIGRAVKAGEVLAELDCAQQSLRLAEAEARLASYPERIFALRQQQAAMAAASSGTGRAAAAAIAAARARAAAAGTEAAFSGDLAERQRRDSEAGGMAPIEAARTRADARKAAALRDSAVGEQRRIAGDMETAKAERLADSASLSSVLAQTASEWVATQAQVAQLRNELEARRIRAPVDGVIGAVTAMRLGEVLAPGARLATIIPRGSLRVVATFDPAHAIGRLGAGQVARLRLDGFSWTQYGDVPARVQRVAAEPDGQALRVELALMRRPEQALQLRHGMTGTVDVTVEQVSPAILILRALGQVLA